MPHMPENTRFRKAYGNRIQVMREKKGYSVVELAGLLNVSRQAIRYFELGQRIPKMDMAFAIWKLLGVDFEQVEHIMNLYDAMDKDFD